MSLLVKLLILKTNHFVLLLQKMLSVLVKLKYGNIWWCKTFLTFQICSMQHKQISLQHTPWKMEHYTWLSIIIDPTFIFATWRTTYYLTKSEVVEFKYKIEENRKLILQTTTVGYLVKFVFVWLWSSVQHLKTCCINKWLSRSVCDSK